MKQRCLFCDGIANLVDTDIAVRQQVTLTFSCPRCDRTFVEIYEYSRAENVAGEEIGE
jgi:4-hydroxy-3-methylbut-2-en-1-yl diphosphate synthase IspG/GcpE